MILCILIKIQPGAAGGSCEMSCSCSNAGADGRVSSEIGAGFALDCGIELVAPPEPARLAGSSADSARNEAPISRAELAHQTA